MSGHLREAPPRAPRVRLDTLKTVRRGTPRISRPPQKSTPQCANPSCVRSDVLEDDGKLICRSCGFVLSDVQITQELTFGEAANGAAVVQGVYVGANEESARNPGLGPSKLTGGMDSRQVTERNGQHHISNLVAALRLSASQKDRAYLMWTLAMKQNFIQGRVTKHVAAVCLYIACRQDKECRLMLVDFSDLLEMNVFKLGQIYTAFVEALNLSDNHLNLGVVNPENLIHRFAQDLEFGPDEHKIANEAVQVLKRFDRDWITTGRRPAGVCAAALILAARMNNYRRTVREVIYTAKVCEITINKRLDEFRSTDSSKLTVEEFRHHGENLAAVHDPPAFYSQFESKKVTAKSKNASLKSAPAGHITEVDATAEPEQTQRNQIDMPPPPLPPIDPALLAGESDSHIDALAGAEAASIATLEGQSSDDGADAAGAKRKRGRKKGSKNKALPKMLEKDMRDEMHLENEVESLLMEAENEAQASAVHESLNTNAPDRIQTNNISNRTLHDSAAHTRRDLATRSTVRDTEYISESEFANDPEVINAKLTDAEKQIKERIWVHENADYLRQQQAKKLRNELAVAAGTARVPKKRSRIKRPRIGDTAHYPQHRDEHGNLIGASSPAESVKMMLSHRGYSKKLDYATVERLYRHHPKSPSASDMTRSERGSTRAQSEQSEQHSPAHNIAKLGEGYPRSGAIEGNETLRPFDHTSQQNPIVIEDNGDDDSSEMGSDDYFEGEDDASLQEYGPEDED